MIGPTQKPKPVETKPHGAEKPPESVVDTDFDEGAYSDIEFGLRNIGIEFDNVTVHGQRDLIEDAEDWQYYCG